MDVQRHFRTGLSRGNRWTNTTYW